MAAETKGADVAHSWLFTQNVRKQRKAAQWKSYFTLREGKAG